MSLSALGEFRSCGSFIPRCLLRRSALSSINPASDKLTPMSRIGIGTFSFGFPNILLTTCHHPQDKMPWGQLCTLLAQPPTFLPFHSPSRDRFDLSLCHNAVKRVHPLLLFPLRTGSWGITARPVGSSRSSGIAEVTPTGIEGASWRQ
jgi:hypothetical protein